MVFGFGKKAKIGKLLEAAQEDYENGNVPGAMAKLAEAKPIAHAADDKAAMAAILNMEAGIHRQAGRNQEALDCCTQALQLAKQNNEPPQRLGYLNDNIAQILNRMERKEEALQYYAQSTQQLMQDDEPDAASAARSLSNMAAIYAELGKVEESRRCMEQCMDLCEKGAAFDEACTYACLAGDRWIEAGQHEQARVILQQAVDKYYEALKSPEDKTMLMFGPQAAALEMIKEEHKKDSTAPIRLVTTQVHLSRAHNKLGKDDGVPATLPKLSVFERKMYAQAPNEFCDMIHGLGISLHNLAQETGKKELFDRAEKTYLAGLNVVKQYAGSESEEFIQKLADLKELYQDTGRDPQSVQV